MSSTESPAELRQGGGEASDDKGAGKAQARRPAAPDSPDAVLAALEAAEIGSDDEPGGIGRLADTSADVIEILDAEPILAEDEPLAGAADPIDVVKRRARNETPRDRIALYEKQSEKLLEEGDKAQAGALQHEIAVQLERLGSDEADVTRAFATALATEPSLRPNLWALRRHYYRKSLWPSLLKLMDIEARHASTQKERAEVWTEKGHILEDLLDDIEEAIICYRTAYELDPSALGPLAALEKLLTQRDGHQDGVQVGQVGRPSEELLAVYRGLSAATKEPGRRVALLIELARIEEEFLRAEGGSQGAGIDRVLSYLHEAYDASIDQTRVIDEIVRITAAAGRVPECLTALDVKVEIIEMHAESATPQRRALLFDQVVAIRRRQATLAREKLGNQQMAWQYLDLAQQRSPGDPLLLPELLAAAEMAGRHADVALLLQQREEMEAATDGGSASIGLWLKRTLALRAAGEDAEADQLEQRIAAHAPQHYLLLLGQQRRAMQKQDLGKLERLLLEEAILAADGVADAPGGERQRDPLWAAGATLLAAQCTLRTAQPEQIHQVRELLKAAGQRLGDAAADPTSLTLRGLIEDSLEDLYVRAGRWAELAALLEERLARVATGAGQADEARRLCESLVELYRGPLGQPDKAAALVTQLIAEQGGDLRLLRKAVLLARRAGDATAEVAGLAALIDAEQRLGVSGSRAWDLLRRAELLAGLDKSAEAAALYEEVLKLRPGEPLALEPLEQILRGSGRNEELAALLRAQVDVASAELHENARGAGDTGDQLVRLLAMQAKLADLYENELKQPLQAIAAYKAMLTSRPGYAPALRALLRLYRVQGDVLKQLDVLQQLSEGLPTSAARAQALTLLGELREEAQPTRHADIDEAYSQALGTMPLPSPAAAHAALGRLRVQMQKRAYGGLGEVYDALGDTLGPEEALAAPVGALLAEEAAALTASSTTATGSALDRAENKLGRASKELTSLSGEAAAAYPEAPTQLGLTRVLLSQRREDPKQQGAALAALGLGLLERGAKEPRPVAAEMLLRAGLLGTLCEDEPAQQAEAGRRLLAAYKVLGDVSQVLVPLGDLLTDPALCEQLVRGPGGADASLEMIKALRARQALCPESEAADRAAFALAEAEINLMRVTEADEPTRRAGCQAAAEAALRALTLEPRSVHALLLLRQAALPTEAELDPLRSEPRSDESKARLGAYALYTLKLAGEISDAEVKADLYIEAAQLLDRLGEAASAAAALREALEHRPEDAGAFSRLHSLLQRHAEEKGDPAPLLELLNFRLGELGRLERPAQSGAGDGEARSEAALRVQLLSQRAALHQASGQLSDAAADLSALLQIDPRHGLSHRKLAALYAQHNDVLAAAKHYEEYLQLDASPVEKLAAHQAVAELLSPYEPVRAVQHAEQALSLHRQQRAQRGEQVDTVEAVSAEVGLARQLFTLRTQLGQHQQAAATMRELEAGLPAGAIFLPLRQEALLELAGTQDKHLGERTAAVTSVEKVLHEAPTALPALERLLSLTKAGGDAARATMALARAAQEARKQVAVLLAPDADLSDSAVAALVQIYEWQGNKDAQSLAAQARWALAEALGKKGTKPTAPAPKAPQRSVGPPLRTAAFPPEARGVLTDVWTEIWEVASRVLSPELSTVASNAREQLNRKEVPAAWAAVDQLAQRFGLGSTSTSLPYALYQHKEREGCAVIGSNLVCGAAYSVPISSLPPALFFRLVRRVALLPDRLGPVDSTGDDVLLFLAACCQLVQAPAPALPPELKGRLDERTKAVDRAISRKERNALRAMVPRLSVLAGEDGRAFVRGWQQAVRQGSAQLALGITGDLGVALAETGAQLDGEGDAARIGRALCAFSVSAEVQVLRRELGLGE